MRARPRISEFALVGVATGWSFSLVLAGLWSVVTGATRATGFSVELVSAGLGAIAAGHVVFLSCVAERIFPRANRTIVLWMEMISCVIFFVASTICLVALFGAASLR
ncbi:MAG: hypothetical protein KJZ65_13755 [Phycisphaerales bacterium]|nr:hypothetical protein [Phycisphaerales bacterium]